MRRKGFGTKRNSVYNGSDQIFCHSVLSSAIGCESLLF